MQAPRPSLRRFQGVGALVLVLILGFSVKVEAAAAKAKARAKPVQQALNNPLTAGLGWGGLWGGGGGYGNRAVGGVSINAEGVLENAGADLLGRLAKVRTESLDKVPADLNEAVPLRKISLRRLEEAVNVCVQQQKPLPDEIKLLAGLQQIRYVFVYPEEKDVVLVGPAEGWKVDQRGNVIGATSGRPVMLLDDLLLALRTAQAAAQGGITCSIDPTAEGLKQAQKYLSQQKTIGDPKTTAANIEEALGKQQISFTGVPATSHFARVLVAADYRMKRLAMNFEPSPVKALPSFLQMMGGGSRAAAMLPRWWLEPKYESVLRDQEGLAWEFQGGSVKAMTEEDFLAAGGQREHSGRANPLAQKWADKMTEHYGELSVAEPIFGELRNCMELAIVGALVARERLLERAGCSLPVLMDSAVLKTTEFAAPSQVDSKVSMLRKGHNWVISASGGVAIHPGEVMEKVQRSDAPGAVREKNAPKGKANWWWN